MCISRVRAHTQIFSPAKKYARMRAIIARGKKHNCKRLQTMRSLAFVEKRICRVAFSNET